MAAWSLVTPASRGIGLAVARRILETTKLPLVTTARRDLDQAKENVLAGLDGVDENRVHVVRIDVLGEALPRAGAEPSDVHVEESSIAEAAAECKKLFSSKDDYLHLGIALPGLLFPEKSPQQIDYDNALLTFKTNTMGPMMLMKHFFPFLPRKATKLDIGDGLPDQAVWATLSARVGSISDNGLGGWYSYRASKAAVNQLTKTFDLHLKTSAGSNALAISLHPGTVKTGLSKEFWNSTKPGKLFSPEYSAEKLVDVVRTRQAEHRGRCFDWKAEEVPP